MEKGSSSETSGDASRQNENAGASPSASARLDIQGQCRNSAVRFCMPRVTPARSATRLIREPHTSTAPSRGKNKSPRGNNRCSSHLRRVRRGAALVGIGPVARLGGQLRLPPRALRPRGPPRGGGGGAAGERERGAPRRLCGDRRRHFGSHGPNPAQTAPNSAESGE